MELTASPMALALASVATFRKLNPVCANFVWLNAGDDVNSQTMSTVKQVFIVRFTFIFSFSGYFTLCSALPDNYKLPESGLSLMEENLPRVVVVCVLRNLEVGNINSAYNDLV